MHPKLPIGLAIAAAALAALVLSSCGKEPSPAPKPAAPAAPTENRPAPSPADPAAPSDDPRSEGKSESEAVLMRVSDAVCPEGLWRSDLSPAEQVFRRVWELEAEVNNGGFSQFYANSSGDDAAETARALEAIGAQATAKLVARANGLFPGGKPPRERDARLQLLEKIDDAAFDALDKEFYEHREDLSALLAAYVAKHRTNVRGADPAAGKGAERPR